MKKLKLFITSILIGFGILMSVTPVAHASLFQNSVDQACSGVNLSDTSQTCGDSSSNVNGALTLAINVLSLLGGIFAVIMLIIGGLKYITSQGEASNTAGAKNTILYAIIGLVVIALAQVIVRFTLNKAASTQCPAGTSLQGSVCR